MGDKMNKDNDEIFEYLQELLPRIRNDGSQMAKDFYATAKSYIKTYRQLYKIIEISDKNQSALMETADELSKSREELKHAKEIAENANKSKTQFLSSMSHEIRTPLNGIIGFTDLLKETSLDEIQKKYVENVNTSANSLLEIINDILDLSKIEAGKLELDQIKTDLFKLIDDSLSIIRFQAQDKGLSLTLDIDENMPRYAIVDPVRLRHVLVNPLGNAVKFTSKGEVKLTIGFEPLDEESGQFKFSVKDTGIGINIEQKKQLFRAFSQADSSVTRKYGGTGLGLVISNSLVNKMGGNIEIESEPGEGTRFHFAITTKYFRADKENKFLYLNIDDEKRIIEHISPKIMIVEDVQMNMQLIKTIIKKQVPNAIIIEAENGNQAYEYAINAPLDIIFMDIQMPVMNGLDATKMIRKAEPTDTHVPIIALTAVAIKEDIDTFLEAGMDDYVTKPISQLRLFQVLKKYLGKTPEQPIKLSSSTALVQLQKDLDTHSLDALDRVEEVLKLGLGKDESFTRIKEELSEFNFEKASQILSSYLKNAEL